MSTSTATKPAETNGALAKQEPAPNVVAVVGKQVRAYIEKGTLQLPADYSPENALKSAWLTLQQVQDREGRAALLVCSQESIANALLDMIVQGLNPAKKQIYFIAYGKALVCQRSYFGDMALAERVQPGIEIYSDVVYDGDTFEYEKVRGRTVITRHVSKLENQNVNKIIAAYCGVVNTATGEDLGIELMTIEQIKKSWGMSKTYKEGGNSPHNSFPDQMALRTVIRRRTKGIINSSSDALLQQAIRRQDDDALESELAEFTDLNANQETLSLSAAGSASSTLVEPPKGEAKEEAKDPSASSQPGEDLGF